jgi:serine/threonine protein kinase
MLTISTEDLLVSPEVIRGKGYVRDIDFSKHSIGQGYSFSCDWWSLGVILFECLYGYPPFLSNSVSHSASSILPNDDVIFSTTYSYLSSFCNSDMSLDKRFSTGSKR